MNIFFGIKSEQIQSRINIPKFRNNTTTKNNHFLYKLNIKNSNWQYEKLVNLDNSDFYFIDKDHSNNDDIYVISNENEIIKISEKNEIVDLNNFTNTSPDYRANLKVNAIDGGFSSYQSDYPFNMTKKNGSVLSPISTLTNDDADLNYLVFKNIYNKPIIEDFNIYIINIKTKEVLDTLKAKSNRTNIFEIKKSLIKSENYIFSKKFIGIPIYISIKNKHVSMEHTHPPHEYILSKDKFYRVSLLKKQIDEIIT